MQPPQKEHNRESCVGHALEDAQRARLQAQVKLGVDRIGEQCRAAQEACEELRRVAEPLITLAKVDSVANRRLAFARLRDKEAVGNLFTVFGPRYQARPGGYLRILKCGFRAGDNAPMAYVELVDRPQAAG